MTYRLRLTATVLVINLFVILLAATSAYLGYRQYQERAETTTQNLAEVLESNLVNNIKRVDVSLLALLDIHKIHHAEHHRNPALMNGHIEQIRARLPEADAIRLTDKNGFLISGNDVGQQDRVNLSDRPHFTQLKNNPDAGLLISKPQISRINDKWVIVLARRIDLPDGSFDGMIFAALALDFLSQQFASLNLGPGGIVSLRDHEFGLIAQYPELDATKRFIGQKNADPAKQALFNAGASKGTFRSSGPDFQNHTVTFHKLQDLPLYVSVGLSSTDYLKHWRNDSLKLLSIALLFLIASIYAAHVQYRAWQNSQKATEYIAHQEALYHELVEDTPMLVVRYLPDTRIIFGNAAYADFLGVPASEIPGKHRLDFIPNPADKEQVKARIAALTPEHPVAAHGQHRAQGKNGQTRWTQWTDRAFFDSTGNLTHLQAIGEDITEQKRTRDIRAARMRLMEFASDHSMNELLTATLDEAGNLTESPIGFYHFLEADQKTLSLQTWSTRTQRDYCKAEGSGRHYNVDEAGIWVEAVHLRRPVIHNDYATQENKRGLPPGHAALLREMVVPVFRKGLIVAILGVGNKPTPYTEDDMQAVSLLADLAWDFAESKRLEAELVAMATTDFLTGLFNRRYFMGQMDNELARLKRVDITRAAVLMLDLDHFKRVNDRYGHAAGDAVLKQFASTLQGELRKIDTAGRLGGEEFAILLLDADLAAAETFAERLRSKIAETPIEHDGQILSITVSIGITVLHGDDATAETALSRADEALYEAKNTGRNRVRVAMPV
ncbi:diguanylate cyclase [Azonexus sp.]|uniref:diguanylate cyclase n=1 Tax=Azonexus sp. TaxID=1872668 RepID=UPI0027B98B12|nr:diguanylate cyclase [Azonexus sp.]